MKPLIFMCLIDACLCVHSHSTQSDSRMCKHRLPTYFDTEREREMVTRFSQTTTLVVVGPLLLNFGLALEKLVLQSTSFPCFQKTFVPHNPNHRSNLALIWHVQHKLHAVNLDAGWWLASDWVSMTMQKLFVSTSGTFAALLVLVCRNWCFKAQVCLASKEMVFFPTSQPT